MPTSQGYRNSQGAGRSNVPILSSDVPYNRSNDDGGFWPAFSASWQLGITNSVFDFGSQYFSYSGVDLTDQEKRDRIGSEELSSGAYNGVSDSGRLQAIFSQRQASRENRRLASTNLFGSVLGSLLDPLQIGSEIALFVAATAVVAVSAPAAVPVAGVAFALALYTRLNSIPGKAALKSLQSAYQHATNAVRAVSGASVVTASRVVNTGAPLLATFPTVSVLTDVTRKALGEEVSAADIALNAGISGGLAIGLGWLAGITGRGKLLQAPISGRKNIGDTPDIMFKNLVEDVKDSGVAVTQGKGHGEGRVHLLISIPNSAGNAIPDHQILDFTIGKGKFRQFSEDYMTARKDGSFIMDKRTGSISFRVGGREYLPRGYKHRTLDGVVWVPLQDPLFNPDLAKEFSVRLGEVFPKGRPYNDHALDEMGALFNRYNFGLSVIPRTGDKIPTRAVVLNNLPGTDKVPLSALRFMGEDSAKLSRFNKLSSSAYFGTFKRFIKAIKTRGSNVYENDAWFKDPVSLFWSSRNADNVFVSISVKKGSDRVAFKTISREGKYSGNGKILTDDRGSVFLILPDNILTQKRVGEDLFSLTQGGNVIRIMPDIRNGIRPHPTSNVRFDPHTGSAIFELRLGGETYDIFYKFGRVVGQPVSLPDEVLDGLRLVFGDSTKPIKAVDLPKNLQADIRAVADGDIGGREIIEEKVAIMYDVFRDVARDGAGGSIAYRVVRKAIDHTIIRPFATLAETRVYKIMTDILGGSGLFVQEFIGKAIQELGIPFGRGFFSAARNFANNAMLNFAIRYAGIFPINAIKRKSTNIRLNKAIQGNEEAIKGLSKKEQDYVKGVVDYRASFQQVFGFTRTQIGLQDIWGTDQWILNFRSGGKLVEPFRRFLKASILKSSPVGKKVVGGDVLEKRVSEEFTRVVTMLGENQYPRELIGFRRYLRDTEEYIGLYDDVFLSGAPHADFVREAAHFTARQFRYGLLGTSNKAQFQKLLRSILTETKAGDQDSLVVLLDMVEVVMGMPTHDNRLRNWPRSRSALHLAIQATSLVYLNLSAIYDIVSAARLIVQGGAASFDVATDVFRRKFRKIRSGKPISEGDLSLLEAVSESMEGGIASFVSGGVQNFMGVTGRTVIPESLVTHRAGEGLVVLTGLKSGLGIAAWIINVFTKPAVENTLIRSWQSIVLQAKKLGVDMDKFGTSDEAYRALLRPIVKVKREGVEVSINAFEALDEGVLTAVGEILKLTQMSHRRMFDIMFDLQKAAGGNLRKHSDLRRINPKKVSAVVQRNIHEMSAVISESAKKKPYGTDIPSFLLNTLLYKYFTQFRSYLFASNRADLLLNLSSPNSTMPVLLAAFGTAIAHELNDHRAGNSSDRASKKRDEGFGTGQVLGDLSHTIALGQFAHLFNALLSPNGVYGQPLIGDPATGNLAIALARSGVQSVQDKSFRPLWKILVRLGFADNTLAIILGQSANLKELRESLNEWGKD